VAHQHKIRNKFCPYVLIFFSLLFSLPAIAGDFHLDTTVLGQVRDNDELEKEVPVNGYLGLGVNQPSWHLSGESNMRFFRDFDQKVNDYDLYQTVLHFKPLEYFQLDLGRQFINQGFTASVIDGIMLQLMQSKQIDVTLYSGIPRSVEIGDFNRNDGLLSGLTVAMKKVHNTTAHFHFAWRKNDITQSDLKKNDELYVGVDVSHQFPVTTTPMIYGLFEYDVAAKVINTGTAGIDIYPISQLALNAEFNYFNINRDTNRPTIFSLFTQGNLMQGRFAATWTIVPEYLDFICSYSYQNEKVIEGDRQQGHLIDAAFQVSVEQVGFHIEPGYYYQKSFGGHLNGVRALIHEQFTDKFYADLGVDFAKYVKITNNNDNAFSTIIWSGYEVVKGLTLSGGFEYNTNTFFNRDIRGSFKVAYVFDHGI